MPWSRYQHNPSNTKLLKSALAHVRAAIKDVNRLNIHPEDKKYTLTQLEAAEQTLQSGYVYERSVLKR